MKVQYDITAKLFKLLLAFMKEYINNSFNITMYVNMNRIMKAEHDVNLIHRDMRTLMRKANFYRMQNVVFTKYFAHKWVLSCREQIKAAQESERKIKRKMEKLGTTGKV